jgi:hypothetical protein
MKPASSDQLGYTSAKLVQPWDYVLFYLHHDSVCHKCIVCGSDAERQATSPLLHDRNQRQPR